VSQVFEEEYPSTADEGALPPKPYGLLAEFADPDRLTEAVRRAKAEGYSRMDAYTPYPVADVADALGVRKTEMSALMFTGGLVGALGGFLMQYWTMSVDYPLNIAGRPFLFPDTSWPSFIPITFEMTVLTTAMTGLFGFLAACGLPRLHHPLFGVPRFALASRDKFFLCIEAHDPKYDPAATREFLAGLQPQTISEVRE
jgi:hypothetical protein